MVRWLSENGTLYKHYEDCPDDNVIRVMTKLFPKNAKVAVPGERKTDKPFDMLLYRKSVVWKRKGEDEWNHGMYRKPAKHDMDFDGQDVDFCIIFLQEPRYWIDEETDEPTDVCFKAVTEEISRYKVEDLSLIHI